MIEQPTIGRIVWYRTDGRNGLVYDLPAIITCTHATHPGSFYPDGASNPLPVPDEGHVHLTVFTPGGVGSKVGTDDPVGDDSDYVGARSLSPGSGTYVEWNVPHTPLNEPADCDADGHDDVPPRTWRWPTRG